MIVSLAAVLLFQGSPTVGDTIWVERRVPAREGVEVRAPRWTLEGDVELLGRPVLRREGSQIIVAFPVVAWRPGTHRLSVPGPILIEATGRTDSLPVETRTITVQSILPADQDPARLRVQPAAGLVTRQVRSPFPVLGALALAALVMAGVVKLWWRRGPALGSPFPPAGDTPVEIGVWIEAGEPRAVAALAARELRRTIADLLPAAQSGLDRHQLERILAEQRPQWPVAAIAATLGDLEENEFGAEQADDPRDLFERARDLIESLPRVTA